MITKFTKEDFETIDILIRDDFPNLESIIHQMKAHNDYIDSLEGDEIKIPGKRICRIVK